MSPFMKSSLPPKSLELPITPCLAELARLLALARKQGHDHTRRPEQDMGSDQANFDKDFIGVLGEIAILDAMERAGMQPEGYTLLADRPPDGPDFFLGFAIGFDAKSIPDGQSYLCVNEMQRQRLDAQNRTAYILPIIVAKDTASVYAPIPFRQVADWELRQGRSQYRSIPVSLLHPLARLEDLPQW